MESKMSTKICHECKSEIHINAKKCPYCQSEVEEVNVIGALFMLFVIATIVTIAIGG